MATQNVVVAMHAESIEELDRLAAEDSQQRDELINAAVDQFLAVRHYQMELVEQGLKEVAAGHTVPMSEVMERAKTWGR